MNDKKKGCAFRLYGGLTLLVALCSLGSATSLTFETMFPACTASNTTETFESSLRCACYFIMPNLHLDTLKDLVWNALGDSFLKTGDAVLSALVNYGSALVATITLEQGNNAQNILDKSIDVVKLIIVAPWTLIYGIFSSVLVYVLLMTFEFVKTYLFIAVGWSLWSTVLFQEIRGKEMLASPSFMAVLVSAILIIGSIVLLSFDVTIWGDMG